MKKLVSLFVFLLLMSSICLGQKPRYTGGISGTSDGDNALTLEAFDVLTPSNLQKTSFLITNKASDEVDLSLEIAITYTCNRVKKETTVINRLRGGASYHTGDFLNSTSDPKCIKTEVDGTRNTIVGITYRLRVVKNYSADERERVKKFNAYMANASKHLNSKNYKMARDEVAKAMGIYSTDQEIQSSRALAEKIEAADAEQANTGSRNAQKNNQASNSSAQNKGDDFWEDKPVGNSQTSMERGGDNKEAYKVYERNKEAEERKARQEKDYVDNINRQLADNERQRQESARKIDVWGNNLYSTYYAAQAATEARNRLNANSKLSGNYNSVEELEAEFNQKYNSINQDVNEYTEATNQSLQSGANLLFNDGSASGQAAGELVGLLGSVINNNKGEKEKRERAARLEKERKAYLEELNRKKWNAILELRSKLFEQFTDGGTPLSKHQIQSPEVYCFVYSFPTGGMDQTSPNLYISNVFPIAQYNDGTWPFKNTLVTDIKKKTNIQNIVLLGYYTDKNMAEQMRNSLVNLSQKAQLKPVDIAYQGKSASGVGGDSDTDFWETGKTNSGSKVTPQTKSNTKSAPVKKKEDDFWNN